LDNNLTESTVSSDTVYEGRILSVHRDVVTLPNGRTATREIVVTRDSVAVVPILPDGRVVMVRQYRYAGGEELLEIPAGRIEPGEDPEQAARRELLEETGLEPIRLQQVAGFFLAVGFATEFMRLYVAQVREAGDAAPDEDEFVRTEFLHPEDIPDAICGLRIRDGKTLSGLLFMAWTRGLPVPQGGCPAS
jgi:ADP-ribose pyrophosphatase